MSWLAIVLWIVIHIPDFLAIIQAIFNLFKYAPPMMIEQSRITISAAIHSGDKEHVKSVLHATLAAFEALPRTV